MDLSRSGLRKMIKHVRTGLQTRPDFQSWDRSGGTALESRPHMFNSGSRLSFGCGPAALRNPWRFLLQFQISNQVYARYAAEFLKCSDGESHDIEITAFDAVDEE